MKLRERVCVKLAIGEKRNREETRDTKLRQDRGRCMLSQSSRDTEVHFTPVKITFIIQSDMKLSGSTLATLHGLHVSIFHAQWSKLDSLHLAVRMPSGRDSLLPRMVQAVSST